MTNTAPHIHGTTRMSQAINLIPMPALRSTITPGVKAECSPNASTPLFKQHACKVCEDTGLVSTANKSDAGDFLNGRCWNTCAAGESVVWDAQSAQFVAPATSVPSTATTLRRFELSKVPSTKKPWIIQDTFSDPAEDPVLYSFSSEAKARRFKEQMEAEHCKPAPKSGI